MSSLVEVVKVLGRKLDRLTVNQMKIQSNKKLGAAKDPKSVDTLNRSEKASNKGHTKLPVPLLTPIVSTACAGCVTKTRHIATLADKLVVQKSLADGIVFQLECDVGEADNRASKVDCENETLKNIMDDVEMELASQRGENVELIQTNETLKLENARLLKANESVSAGEQLQQQYADLVVVNETLRQQNADLIKSNETLKMQSTVTTKRIAATKILIRRLGEENARLSKFKGKDKFEPFQ